MINVIIYDLRLMHVKLFSEIKDSKNCYFGLSVIVMNAYVNLFVTNYN